VPCYDVEKGQWKSAADRSPFHTQYISKALDGAKKAEVRLLKKFLKTSGIYGAEISTGGFSGYVSEVLVVKFGSFESVLAAAADFRQGQVVAVDDNYDADVVKGFQSPVVIIDPVDPRRNLGTAVSPESAGRLALAARAYLRKPSVRFFARQPARVNKRLYPNIVAVEFSHRRRSPDTIWGQMKRSAGSLAKQLELAGFTVFRFSCYTDEQTSGAFAFLLESTTLPPYVARKGPEIFRRSDTDSFISRANGTLAMWADRDMRVSVISRRKETDAKKLLRSLLQKKDSGVARDMITSTAGKLRIYSGSERRLSGPVKAAVDELASTESLIFFF
jgi:tRNA nucleotidyltransferase (CCA-adding enzyme)